MTSWPADRRYTSEHEWIKPESGNECLIGITEFAKDQLGDVVYVELPKIGQRIEGGKSCGTIESVKAAADLFAPVSGEVLAVNDALADAPQLVNEDPHGKGWLLRVRVDSLDQLNALLDAEHYHPTVSESN